MKATRMKNYFVTKFVIYWTVYQKLVSASKKNEMFRDLYENPSLSVCLCHFYCRDTR